MRSGIYPPELRSVNLDTDWLYRRLGRRLAAGAEAAIRALLAAGSEAAGRTGRAGRGAVERLHGPRGVLARTWPSGAMGLGIMVMLLLFLLAYYAA
jgi:multicomponent Na+:H+ antiporter subunit D